MSSLPLPIAAFLAGVVSFLSPCVLPLVPGYVSLVSGATVEELRTEEKRALPHVMMSSLMFITGFSLVFIALGAVATEIGQLTHQYYPIMIKVAGVIIIVFGLHLTGLFKIKWLYADKRLHQLGQRQTGLIGAFLVGFSFAFGWTPCIGPILATILTFAGTQARVWQGVGLLALYSAGLAVPFLLTTVGIERFLQFYSRFRRHLHAVEVGSGVLLILIGALVLTHHFTWLAGYLSFLNRFSM
jgi:cytochrome c-type biogenesis protein